MMRSNGLDLLIGGPPCEGLIIKGAAETAEVIGAFRHLLLDLANRSPEVVQRLTDLAKPGKQLVSVQIDPEAASADMVVMRLDPADGLLRLVAALRAGDVDLSAVEQFALSLRGAA